MGDETKKAQISFRLSSSESESLKNWQDGAGVFTIAGCQERLEIEARRDVSWGLLGISLVKANELISLTFICSELLLNLFELIFTSTCVKGLRCIVRDFMFSESST